ncbi:hypothetical protein K2Z83_27020 [Oscillochloris sp. ZM17-4]|uniref:hypothetical protein n=1 Tax=Oscillochloris sp. ZM17-4 TaxID=2866714 RepID=UPI001C72CB9B|nr:hypothetical protein [Oscillochloris sp. ZM17-4]MBX0331307.1 hypothetical protein [Oscillochloris sp. ZM17-4]
MATDNLSRAQAGIDFDDAGDAVVDPQTAGETSGSNVTMYDQAKTPADFTSGQQQFRGEFYFRDGHFVLIYIGHPDKAYPQLTRDTLAEHFGEPVTFLRSRAGKQHRLYLYPDKGVAFSAGVREVGFVEIFHPSSLEQYQSQFYLNPGKFIR